MAIWLIKNVKQFVFDYILPTYILWTPDVPACSAVPQPTAPPRGPVKVGISSFRWYITYVVHSSFWRHGDHYGEQLQITVQPNNKIDYIGLILLETRNWGILKKIQILGG